LLDIGSAEEVPDEWERAPSFWFPSSGDEWETFALMGLEEEVVAHAAIWGQPLSRYTGDLATARRVWDKAIAVPLTAKGWEPYGQKVITPTGEWGIRVPIHLDHHEIAKAMESGDLRSALPRWNKPQRILRPCALRWTTSSRSFWLRRDPQNERPNEASSSERRPYADLAGSLPAEKNGHLHGKSSTSSSSGRKSSLH